ALATRSGRCSARWPSASSRRHRPWCFRPITGRSSASAPLRSCCCCGRKGCSARSGSRNDGFPEMIAYVVTILTLVGIVAILGLALNLQWGLCGMVNFGMAGFFALGAYTAALLALAGAGSLAATLAAALVCAAACGFVALISLRLSEEYLAILTLGFGEVIRLFVLNEEWLTHGSLGLPGI